jgi:hypothetical protein
MPVCLMTRDYRPEREAQQMEIKKAEEKDVAIKRPCSGEY